MKLSRIDGINVRFGLLVLSFTILNRIAAISEGSIKESSRLPQFSSFSHHTAYTKFVLLHRMAFLLIHATSECVCFQQDKEITFLSNPTF